MWCATLLTTTVVGVAVVEQAVEPLVLGQAVVDGTLLCVAIKFGALLTLQEEEVYLAVVVGKGALRRVTQEAYHDAENPDAYAPRFIGIWYGLRLESETQGDINKDEPHVLGKAVKGTSQQRAVVGKPRQLSVGGVAEVSKHKQQDACDVQREVVEVEEHSRRGTYDDREYGDGVGHDTQTAAEQCYHKSYRTCEVHVEPLFCVRALVC